MWGKKKPPNVTKVQSHVMLVLHNIRMVPSNVRKNKGTIEYDKDTITCDVSTTQCEDGTIKCDVLIIWYNKLPINGYRKKKKKKKRGHCIITLKGYISCKSILKFSIRHWLIDPDFSGIRILSISFEMERPPVNGGDLLHNYPR